MSAAFSLDESEIVTVRITRGTNWSFDIVVEDEDGLPENLEDVTQLAVLFKEDESDRPGDVATVPVAQHSASAGTYVDTGAETLTFDADARTLTRDAGSWLTDGFAAGQRCRIAGTEANDGSVLLEVATATVLTVAASDDLVGPGSVADETIAGSGVAITTPQLLAADLRRGIVRCQGLPADLEAKDLGTLFVAARMIRGGGEIQQTPPRSWRVRLEG